MTFMKSPLKTLVVKNIPIISFVQRAWLLIIFTILTNCIPLWNHAFWYVNTGKDEWGNAVWQGVTVFDIVGSVSYIPGIVLAAYLMTVFATHIYFRQTIDLDAHNGTYVRDWQELTSSQRVLYATIIRVGTLIASALIAAGIVK